MKKVVTKANSDTFNLSISDLMAGLLAIFILILCYYIVSFNEMKNEYEGNNQLRTEMLHLLENKLKKERINVIVKPETGLVRLSEKTVLFESGSDVTNDTGEEVIKKLGRAIYDTM